MELQGTYQATPHCGPLRWYSTGSDNLGDSLFYRIREIDGQGCVLIEFQVVRNKTDFFEFLSHRTDGQGHYQDGDISFYLLTVLPGVRTIGPCGAFTNAHHVKLDAGLRQLERNTWIQLQVDTVFNPWARTQTHTLGEGTEVWVRVSAGWGTVDREDQDRVNCAEAHTLTRLPATVAAIVDTYIPHIVARQPEIQVCGIE